MTLLVLFKIEGFSLKIYASGLYWHALLQGICPISLKIHLLFLENVSACNVFVLHDLLRTIYNFVWMHPKFVLRNSLLCSLPLCLIFINFDEIWIVVDPFEYSQLLITTTSSSCWTFNFKFEARRCFCCSLLTTLM